MLFDENHLTIHIGVSLICDNLFPIVIMYLISRLHAISWRHFWKSAILFCSWIQTRPSLACSTNIKARFPETRSTCSERIKDSSSLWLYTTSPQLSLYFIFPLQSPSLHFPSVSFPQPLLLWKARFFKRKNRRTFLDVTFEISTGGSISGKKN